MSAPSALLDRLRPHPHRGDVIAAGAVPLAVAAVLIELRMTQWSLGPRFAVVALVALLILTMGWLAPLESADGPRPYHSALLIAGLLPLALALVLLAEVLGASRPPGAGGLAWTFALEAAAATLAARRANSGACTLIAALAGAVAVEEFVGWVFQPQGEGTFRAILLALSLALIAGAMRLRDRRRRHAVQLINGVGLLTLVLGLSYLVPTLIGDVLSRASLAVSAPQATAPSGWKLWLLAVGFGLVAYAGVDREPGPAYIGVAVLGAFVLLAGRHAANRGSLVGWPLFLLVLGGAGLAVGLRPRKPLPPPPDPPTVAAPTVPLHPDEPAS
jgi:hypothetical protein